MQEAIKKYVLELFAQRYKSHLDAEGFPHDAIDCVLSTGLDSIVDIKAKVVAFSDLKKQPYFEPLAIAFRRVVSILKEGADGQVDPLLLHEPAEKKLFEVSFLCYSICYVNVMRPNKLRQRRACL